MGLLDRLRRPRTPAASDPAPRRAAPPDPDDWRRWPGLTTCIRGESHYRDGFRAVVGRRRPMGFLELVAVDLVRDPGNEHDGNAIKAEIGGHHVGFVAREVAAELAPQLDEAGCDRAGVSGVVRGGRSESSPGGEGEYSLHVWLGRVLYPTDLTLTSTTAISSPWPPPPWEGRGFCPQCGLFKSIEEIDGGRLHCSRCDHVWRP